MEECFVCGVSIAGARLYDAVSNEGVVKICGKCSDEEHIPVIRKPTVIQLKEAERKQSVYERLARFSGFKPRSGSTKNSDDEITLREIVDRNYENKVPKEIKTRPEMVNNFHWIIMRARRMKKLTQTQLAKELQESEAAIKLAEQGLLPEDNHKLVNKFESFLGIRIIRDEFSKDLRGVENSRFLSFDMRESKELTLEDLRNMKKREDALAMEIEDKRIINEDIEENEQKDEISQEEMDRIIFGR